MMAAIMQNIHAGKNDPITSIEGALEDPLQLIIARHPNRVFAISLQNMFIFYL